MPNQTSSNVCQQELTNDQEGSLRNTWRFMLVIRSLCLGTLLVAIDTTIIAVAVPKISTYFKAFDDIQWYGSAYLLTVTAFLPAFGIIYRYFGAKEVYLLSVLIFEVGSVLCAVAPTSATCIGGRAVEGIGAAGLYQGALAVVGLTVELKKRPLYLGIVLSVSGTAVCFGPPLGGVFTDHVSWRWCFWIAASFILVGLFLRVQDLQKERLTSLIAKLKKLDFLRIILIVSAVCCLMFALQWGQVGCLIGAASLFILFGIVQGKMGDWATIPLRIFRQRSIFTGAWFSFFLEMAIYIDLFYNPFYFQSAQPASATSSGLKAIPLGLAQIIAVVTVGAIVTRTGIYVPFMAAGQLVSIIGTVLLTRIAVTTRYTIVAIYIVISGIGFGMGLQMPFTGVQAVLSDDDVPIGNAVIVFFSQMGAAIAIAIGQSVFSNSLQHHISHTLETSQDPRFIDIKPSAVVAAGPTGLKAFSYDPVILRFLQDCFASALVNTFYVALGTACRAVPFAVEMQWLNVKNIGWR